MVGLGVGGNRTLLDFDEIPDVDILRQFRPRPETSERADHAVGTDDRILDMGERSDPCPRADARIF